MARSSSSVPRCASPSSAKAHRHNRDLGRIVLDRHRPFGLGARVRHGRRAVCDEANRAQEKKGELGARERKIRIQSRRLTQQRGGLR